MVELKTLKEINEEFLQSKGYEILCPVAFKLLKQEAIKWIKYARRCHHPLDMPETFKTFFNIFEDDLKDVKYEHHLTTGGQKIRRI